jgi:enamine deaminase RidA (YjgF/YER057c/UK114 family)
LCSCRASHTAAKRLCASDASTSGEPARHFAVGSGLLGSHPPRRYGVRIWDDWYQAGTQDIIAGGVAVQTRQTLENIRTSLQTAGATMADVGECTVFLIDMADYTAMNGVYIEFFPVDPPARATLAVSALPRPAALVEIKCSALIRRR